jgi:hypothetical protein
MGLLWLDFNIDDFRGVENHAKVVSGIRHGQNRHQIYQCSRPSELYSPERHEAKQCRTVL